MINWQRGCGLLVAAVIVALSAAPAAAEDWKQPEYIISDYQTLNEELVIGQNAPVSVTVNNTGYLVVNGNVKVGTESWMVPPVMLVEGTWQTTGAFNFYQGSLEITNGGYFDHSGTMMMARGTGYAASIHFNGGTFVGGKVIIRSSSDGNHGTFRVTGSGNTITMGEFNPTHGNGGTATMIFELDDNDARGNISAINAGSVNWTDITVEVGALAGFNPVKDDVFTLVTVTGSGSLPSLDGMALAGWDSIVGNPDKLYNGSWRLQTSTDGKSLEAVAVPEPATMGLLGLGLVGLVARRRRSRK